MILFWKNKESCHFDTSALRQAQCPAYSVTEYWWLSLAEGKSHFDKLNDQSLVPELVETTFSQGHFDKLSDRKAESQKNR